MVNDEWRLRKTNCKIMVFVDKDVPRLRLCLFATKDIREGEELRYDYGVPQAVY